MHQCPEGLEGAAELLIEAAEAREILVPNHRSRDRIAVPAGDLHSLHRQSQALFRFAPFAVRAQQARSRRR
jgi:hypothetical protein